MNSFTDDITAIFPDMFFLLFIQFFWINWFAIFENDVCLFDKWHMPFQNVAGVIKTHRHDWTTGLFCNLEGTIVEWKKG